MVVMEVEMDMEYQNTQRGGIVLEINSLFKDGGDGGGIDMEYQNAQRGGTVLE